MFIDASYMSKSSKCSPSRMSLLLKVCITSGIAVLLLFSPTRARADAVTEWNAVMVTTVTSQNPFAQARFAAITQLAVFEAVNAITHDYKPYLGTITAPGGASALPSHRWGSRRRLGQKAVAWRHGKRGR
mgnify:CR=1 FL=1